mgnify:CR=1 FL=1
MKVKEIMRHDPTFIRANDTIIDAAKSMEKLDCGVLPIGESTHCIGIITDRDIVLRAIAKDKDIKTTKVSDMMSKMVYVCHEDDNLDKVASIMREHKTNRLVVKNKDEKITGIVNFGKMIAKTEDKDLIHRIIGCLFPSTKQAVSA